ncbi:YpiF family protein [Mammaliicoccus sciuri]|uniref:YpiF family protein n=1 Tax=Mammaliicoccus sciuri TaxID=1296 RepID=UPI0021D0AF82|nr:YpiF family protein [Mammaliicoccus sciuri]MEB6119820.1 YpiF family protein [Mammaliicoccus sciuri]UXV28240.1 YpiF family protein [Mammaliicoccus sciuri]
MLFNHVDLKELKNNLEYIDTAILPVSNIDMNHQLLTSCDQNETVQLVGMLAEKQFKGRLLLTPTFFTSGNQYDHVVSFIQSLKEYGLNNIIILSSDQVELNGDHELYKVNTIPMGDLDDDMKRTLIEDEVKQFMKFIIRTWNK